MGGKFQCQVKSDIGTQYLIVLHTKCNWQSIEEHAENSKNFMIIQKKKDVNEIEAIACIKDSIRNHSRKLYLNS